MVDVSEFDHLDGEGGTVARFTEQDDALSGNDDGIAQCVDLPDNPQGQTFTFLANVTAQFPRESGGGELPVELAVEFYDNPNCDSELTESFDLGELESVDDENVFFQRFDLVTKGTTPGDDYTAVEISPWEWGEAVLEDEAQSASSVAVFIGTGDNTDDGNTPDAGPRQVYFDDLSFTVNDDDENNLLENANFDQLSDDFFSVRTPWPDDDQGPFGWYLTDIESDGGAAVEVLPNAEAGFEAKEGDRAFTFRGIDSTPNNPEDMESDNLDQCVDIRERDDSFAYNAAFRSNERDRVDVVLSYEFYETWDECLNRGGIPSMDDPLRNAEDTFRIASDDSWEVFSTSSVDRGDDDNYARLSIRVADNGGGEDPDLVVFVDDVRLGSAVEDDDDSTSDDDAPSTGSSSSSSPLGCSLGNGSSDPTLPILALIALFGLVAQRKMRNA